MVGGHEKNGRRVPEEGRESRLFRILLDEEITCLPVYCKICIIARLDPSNYLIRPTDGSIVCISQSLYTVNSSVACRLFARPSLVRLLCRPACQRQPNPPNRQPRVDSPTRQDSTNSDTVQLSPCEYVAARQVRSIRASRLSNHTAKSLSNGAR